MGGESLVVEMEICESRLYKEDQLGTLSRMTECSTTTAGNARRRQKATGMQQSFFGWLVKEAQ